MMSEAWDGTERRAGPGPAALQAELKAVRQDVGRLATSVATLGSDERMHRVVESVVEEEERHRQRIVAIFVVGLVAVGLISLIGLRFSGDARDAAGDAKKAAEAAGRVSRYVENCLIYPSRATPGECGNTAATGQQSATVLALFCYLQLPEEGRTDDSARDCFDKAAAQAKAASSAATSSTTVTR